MELANAASMLLPAATLARLAYLREPEWPQQHLLLLAVCAHLPVSVAYHLSVALLGRDRLDNDLRRLDQTMQHVGIVVFACALSGGSAFYTAFVAGVGWPSMLQLWLAGTTTTTRSEGWRPIFVGMLLYMLPMSRHPLGWIALGTAVIGGSAAFTIPRLSARDGGPGSVILHTMMAAHVATLWVWLTLDLRSE